MDWISTTVDVEATARLKFCTTVAADRENQMRGGGWSHAVRLYFNAIRADRQGWHGIESGGIGREHAFLAGVFFANGDGGIGNGGAGGIRYGALDRAG